MAFYYDFTIVFLLLKKIKQTISILSVFNFIFLFFEYFLALFLLLTTTQVSEYNIEYVIINISINSFHLNKVEEVIHVKLNTIIYFFIIPCF